VLLMANAFLGATWLVGLTLLLVARIPREEAMMRDQFGTAYRALEARTGRLLPRWPTAPAAQPAMRSLNTRAEGTGAGETRSRDGS